MNVADTERMIVLLGDGGMRQVETAEAADVVLINGCSVREKAVHKAVSMLGTYQDFKGKILGVGGCVGQFEKEGLFSRAPYLDFVFGTDTIDELPEIIHCVAHGGRRLIYTQFDRDEKFSTETKVAPGKVSAFVNIMKGCDKYCTYCIVPFTRGREKSRTIDEVLEDLARLALSGVREVTLLGQNVNSFGKGNPNSKGRRPLTLQNRIGKVGPDQGEENFPQLLRAIDTDPRLGLIERIRFTSSHPLDFSDELIDCYARPEKGGVGKLARHLHLPVQSGSNTILQKMGRHHRVEGYIEQMQRLKELAPDVALSTDLIVGFPGETDEDFKQTLRLLDVIRYDSIYAFAYSERPGTRAAKLKDDVSVKTKDERLAELFRYQQDISVEQYQKRVGQVLDVLVEYASKRVEIPMGLRQGKLWSGRSSCNRPVHFTAEVPRNLIGHSVRVRILGATGLALYGEWEPEVKTQNEELA